MINWLNINTNTTVQKQNSEIVLNKSDFGSDDANITLDTTYSKISLKVDVQSMDSVIESPLNDDDLISPYSNKQKYMTEYISDGEGTSAIRAFYNMIKGNNTDYSNATEKTWYIQTYKNSKWVFKYEGDETYDKYCPTSGGTYINQWFYPYNLRYYSFIPAIFAFGSYEKKADKSDNSPISSVDMSKYLCISVNGQDDEELLLNHSGMCKYTSSKTGGAFSPQDENVTNYLVFSGSILLNPLGVSAYTKTSENYGYLDIKNHYNDFESFNSDYFHKTVQSDNNSDGRYYIRRWYNSKYPSSTPSTELGTTEYFIPEIGVDKLKKYQYNYTIIDNGSVSSNVDNVSKVPIICCELQIGNKYCVEQFDQSGNSYFSWLTYEQCPQYTYQDDAGTNHTVKLTTFSLGFNPKIGDYIVGQDYDIQNNISIEMNLDDAKGTAIPIKKSDNLSGKVTFTIHGPYNNAIWNNVVRSRHATFFRSSKFDTKYESILKEVSSVMIKDFECKIYSDNANINNFQNKDLIYESAENVDYIESKDDITFKLMTQLTIDECRAKEVSNSINLNTVINIAKSGTPLYNIYNFNNSESAKAEEHYIDAYYNEYHTPKMMYEIEVIDNVKWSIGNTVKDTTLNKTFFILAKEYEDTANNIIKLKLREI